MDVSHALMTVIWSRRNTGLSAGRGLVLFSEKDGYPFFFTSLSLQLTPHGAPATHTHTHWHFVISDVRQWITSSACPD